MRILILRIQMYNLYKGRRRNESPPNWSGLWLSLPPENTTAYFSYIKLTNSTIPDWSDVIALTKHSVN